MQLKLNGVVQALPARIARRKRANTLSSTTVVTTMVFAASPDQVWNGLLFYEQIQERPPLHLRLLLPVPLRTEGTKSQVGDNVMCVYECGDLIKRITRIDTPRHYEFEVIEQNLRIGGGLSLIGGGYTLRSLQAGRTEVGVTTQYVSALRPGWLGGPSRRWPVTFFTITSFRRCDERSSLDREVRAERGSSNRCEKHRTVERVCVCAKRG